MVKALHRAGIEVILDVVYNHTAEGNHLGPMLSFKGVDNRSYYRLMPDDPRYYMDFTGHRQLAEPGAPERAAADHGLAALLGDRVPRRRLPLRPGLGARARALRRRPPVGVLRRHPPGPGALAGQADRRAVGRRARRLPGRQLPGAVVGVERHVPRHDARLLARAGERRTSSPSALSGSSDLYEADGRDPFASINFITAHDGFTLDDLVSYNDKHNEANLEDNRDGTDDNRSWNHGVEGPTDDPAIHALRARQQRNFLTTLMLSQGTPMLLGGDEFGRTQHGNNNAWCQDNEHLLVLVGADARAPSASRRFTQRLIRLRREHPVFRRETFLRGRQVKGSGLAGRVVVSHRRAQDDPRQLAGRRARARDVPQRPRDHDPRALRRGHRGRLVPAAVQRPRRGLHVHAAAPAVRGATGRSSCRPPTRRPSPAARATRPRRRSPSSSRSILVLKRV